MLRRLDEQNQLRFYPGPGRPSRERLTKRQMHLLSESILARAFSKYESILEEIFILYCQGKPGMSGVPVGSYLSPTSPGHARSLVKSGMTFLEWNSPDNVIARCETYLLPDNPIFLAITTNRERLSNIRKVRNAIAHASVEAAAQLRSVIRSELGVLPPRPMTAGEFLITSDRNAPRPQYYLRSYLEVLERVATIAAG